MLRAEVGTTTYYVELIVGVRRDNNDLESIIDPLMDAFEGLTGVSDVDLGVDFGERTLTISMYVDADTEGGAINDAIAAARTAIHQTGGHTPGWENSMPEANDFFSSVKRADLVDC